MYGDYSEDEMFGDEYEEEYEDEYKEDEVGDYGDDDDAGYYDAGDEGDVFQAEFGAHERAGMGDMTMFGTMMVEGKMRVVRDPLERFMNSLVSVYNKIKGVVEFDISSNDIEYIIKLMKDDVNISKRNPSGVLLGYFVTSRGKGSIDPKAVKIVFEKILPKLEHITEPDVIRYGKKWISMEG